LSCAKMFAICNTTSARQITTFTVRQAIKCTANKSARYE
jgi:hypothetical protein